MKKKLLSLLTVSGLGAGLIFGAGAAAAQPGNQAGDSLVNVQVEDVSVLVPISVAANICDVSVNVLAQQLDTGDATCQATAESIATPGNGEGNGNGGNQAGDSLVNVQISELLVALPISVAANVCGLDVNVLTEQLSVDDYFCEATANSEA